MPLSSTEPALRPMPADLPAWLGAFVGEAVRENGTLAENGAHAAVTARVALLNRLLGVAEIELNGELSADEAGAMTGRHPETIRRAVRAGTLPDRRTSPRGHHRIRRGDLLALVAPRAVGYDPQADAQDIAQRRRSR